MTSVRTRTDFGRVGRAVATGASFLALVTGALADDAGVRGFFAQQMQEQENAVRPSPVLAIPTAAPTGAFIGRRPRTRSASRGMRSLTVRLHHPAVSSGSQVAQTDRKPERVSIYEDRTLRRGDAVMMAKGMRIFVGSKSWPYTDADFVSLVDAGRVDPAVQKALAELERLPRT